MYVENVEELEHDASVWTLKKMAKIHQGACKNPLVKKKKTVNF